MNEQDYSVNALNEESAKRRILFEQAPDGIVVIDPQTARFLDFNTAAHQQLGYTREEFAQLSIVDVEAKESAEETHMHIEQVVRVGKDDFDTVQRTRQGEIRNVHVTAQIVNVHGHEVYYCIWRDITERQQSEKALHKTKSLLEATIDSAHNGILVVDQQGVVIKTNTKFAEMWRIPDTIIKSGNDKILLDFVHEQLADPDGFIRKVTELYDTPEAESIDLIRLSDGRFFERISKPMYLDGKAIARVWSFLDITERKLVEDELKKSYDLLHRITAQVPGVVYQYRLYTDGHSAFPFSSPGMYDIYEVTPEEVREDASPVFTRIHPDDYDTIVQTINESARNQTLYHSEFRVILPSQGLRWRQCYANPSRLEDGSTLWYGIISDVTDRKLMEQELIKAKEKAEESDRLKSAFLANMSHEIRTPMNGILGFTEMLKDPDLTGDEQKKYIGIIETGGTRLLNIINDIISISKIESGQMEITESETSVNEQIEYLYTFFKPEAEQKGLELKIRNPLPANKSIIKTDKEKVYAILTNLIKNALKFTSKGSIEFGYSVAETDNYPSLLEFFVKDTGTGILPEQKGDIFKRFIQGTDFLNKSHQGAGLGLSISKGYAEMLGGKIWVESIPGKGSTFYFSLPCRTVSEEKNEDKKSTSKAAVSAHEILNQNKKIKILIAEDDHASEIILEIASKMFSSEVLIAKTGIEAIQLCRDNPDIDLVLMDVRMPEMDGYEATRRIREFNNEVIIIAQTAFALAGEREKALETGCNDYISKPIKQTELQMLMKKLITDKQVVS